MVEITFSSADSAHPRETGPCGSAKRVSLQGGRPKMPGKRQEFLRRGVCFFLVRDTARFTPGRKNRRPARTEA